jgi:WD40 repeat protein
VSFSPDSKRIAVMDRSANHLKIVDVSTREVTVWPNSENRGILNIRFTPDDRLVALAFVGTDEELLLDLTADKVLVRCQSASSGFLGRGAYCHIGHRPFSSVVSLAKSIGADRIAEWALNAKPRRQVYDTSTGRIVGWTPYVESQVLPDGKTIAIYSYDDGCVELWDMPPRTVIHPLLCWAALVCAVALTAWWWHMRRKARRTGALQTATSRAAEGASSTLV